MKRVTSLLLLLSLCLLLFVPALAADTPKVRVSPQKLMADGQSIECEKYNIDGSNYFKLRDMAMLLRGTAACFGISFDTKNKTVYVQKGAEYEPVGTELIAGEDHSDSCVASVWALFVDGEPVEVSTYNIGGSNFYKLRDMGSALGFAVDYDPESNTSFIYSDLLRTAVTTSKEPVGAVKGWTFSAPEERQPKVSFFYKGDYKLESGKVVNSAPAITRLAADAGYVTYRVRTERTGSLLLSGVDSLDCFYASTSMYCFYDYYTGASFFGRTMHGNDSYSDTMLVSFHVKSYPISYKLTIRANGNSGLWLNSYALNAQYDETFDLTVTVPVDYDGLVLALCCGEPSIRNETTSQNSDSPSPGIYYWDDDANQEDWVFIRVAEYAKND